MNDWQKGKVREYMLHDSETEHKRITAQWQRHVDARFQVRLLVDMYCDKDPESAMQRFSVY